jgi:hypothetical protein
MLKSALILSLVLLSSPAPSVMAKNTRKSAWAILLWLSNFNGVLN